MTTNEPTCPKCHGQMWNNIATKRNPKQPDFKCKDKSCDGVIWPPKDGQRAAVAAAPAPATKQGYTSGPHIQGLDDAPVDINRLDRVFNLYDACLAHTLGQVVPKLDASPVGSSPEAVAAITATLFIQASNKGLAA